MTSEEPLYNLDSLAAITEGDKEFEQLLISTFVQEAPRMIHSMRKSFDEGDLVSAGRQAHSLKPNAQMFGVHSIREEILFVEMCGKDDNHAEGLSEAIGRIEQVIGQVVKDLS